MKSAKRILTVFLSLVIIALSLPMTVWAAGPFAGGNGSEADPYKISTTAQLNQIRNYSYSYFILTNNIVFKESDFEEGGTFYNNGYGWKPISTFKGSLNGNGYSIEYLNSYAGSDSNGDALAGLIAINSGDIYNLTMSNCYIIGEGRSDVYTGAFAGINNGNLTQCYSTENVIYSYNGRNSYAGGVVGSNNGTLTLCLNGSLVMADGENIASNYVVGGVAGLNYDEGIITYGINTEAVYGRTAGGIAGHSQNAHVMLCLNTGDVNNETDVDYIYSGGIVGFNSEGSTINGSINKAAVYAYSSESYAYAGGIAGNSDSSLISDCYNAGSISATAASSDVYYACAGGIVGNNICETSDTLYSQTLATVYNLGSVSASVSSSSTKKYAGAIAGYSDAPITSAYYLNNVTKGIGSNDADTDGTKKLTDTQMKSASSYQGFDLEHTWWMSNKSGYDYPQLTLLSEYPAKEIKITKMPDKTYYLGEELDFSGGQMTVTYHTGKSEILDTSKLTVVEYDATKLGKQTVTLIYGHCVIYADVTLVPIKEKVTGLTVTAQPTKLNYVQGQPFNPSGMVITAAYGEDISFELNIAEVEFSYDTSATGQVPVTASYGNVSTTFNIEVAERIATSVAIQSKPISVVFKKGSELVLVGGVLKVYFESQDNYSELIDISADMLSDYDMNTPGEQTVTVTYQGKTDAFTIYIVEGDPGDANGDGVINTTDLAVLKLHLAGVEEETIITDPGYADCNCDRKVDTSDMAMIKLILAGI